MFVLPNLVLATASNERHSGDWPMGISFGDELITIVSSDNPHVAHLRSDKTIEQILTSFVDEYGKPYSPAILLTHRSAPETVRINLAAIVAFRNAIALAFILRARAAAERGYGGLDPTWSDTFDFHPAQIGGTGGMILHSPALLSVVSSGAKLRLTRSPYIPLTDGRLHPDSYLFRSFEKAWIKRYCGKAETEKFGDRLFRSLDVAYQACAVGTKCEGSLNEYGIQVALWVSAIEILAWPNKRHADLESVLLLLNRDSIDERDRKLRYRIKIKNPKTRKPEIRRVSALQRAYVYLYRARNQFLHGNPVRENSLLTLNRTERVGLPRLAAVVYRAALVAYLDPKYPKQIKNLEELRTRVEESFEDNTYGEALAELFGYTR